MTALDQLPESPRESTNPLVGEVLPEDIKEGGVRAVDLKLADVDARMRDQQADPAVAIAETETAETPPEEEAPQEEPGFLTSLSTYFEQAKTGGKGTFMAALSTLGFALSSGKTKIWDWVKGVFGGEEEEAEVEAPAVAEAPEEIPENSFLEDLQNLLQEFGITDSGDEKKNFFLVAVEFGKEIEKEFGIPYQVVVAQACLESGFGKSGLSRKGFNCFGYKAGKHYSGSFVTMEATEIKDGAPVKGPAKFRSYSNIRESFRAYARLISTSRYKAAFKFKDQPKRFLEEVIKGGYATLGGPYINRAIAAVEPYGLSFS
jgi:flagellum-specific peptidoglycan hydrolase FlgJ